MKVEWLLSELDKQVHAYTDLRAKLSALSSDDDAYRDAEREIHKQLRRLAAEAQNVLEAIDETSR